MIRIGEWICAPAVVVVVVVLYDRTVILNTSIPTLMLVPITIPIEHAACNTFNMALELRTSDLAHH